MQTKIIVGSSAKIINPNKKLMQDIKSELTIYNPEFSIIENMGKNTYGVVREYNAFKKIGNDVVIPYGAIDNPRIKRHLFGMDYEVLKQEQYPINDLSEPKIKPRDYQKIAVDIMTKQRRGILVGATGSGKTNIGLYMIKKLGLRALWITHTTDLLRQSRKRAKQIYPNLKSGTITAGKVDVGVHITFATVQTLVNVYESVKDYFNIIIVDEAHHCVGSPTLLTMFYKIMNGLQAEYKYGLTATPKRNDGLEDMTFALLGQIVHEIPEEDLKNAVVPVKYEPIVNVSKYKVSDYTTPAGMVDPHALIEMLNSDPKRNKLIVNFTLNKTKQSNGILVLTRRVAHAEHINSELLLKGVKSALLVGKVKDVDRQEILKSDDVEVIVATNSLAKEGLDLVRYDTLILTYSITNILEFTQVCGRVRRNDGIKKNANVYEVQDIDIEYLSKRINRNRRWADRL